MWTENEPEVLKRLFQFTVDHECDRFADKHKLEQIWLAVEKRCTKNSLRTLCLLESSSLFNEFSSYTNLKRLYITDVELPDRLYPSLKNLKFLSDVHLSPVWSEGTGICGIPWTGKLINSLTECFASWTKLKKFSFAAYDYKVIQCILILPAGLHELEIVSCGCWTYIPEHGNQFRNSVRNWMSNFLRTHPKLKKLWLNIPPGLCDYSHLVVQLQSYNNKLTSVGVHCHFVEALDFNSFKKLNEFGIQKFNGSRNIGVEACLAVTFLSMADRLQILHLYKCNFRPISEFPMAVNLPQVKTITIDGGSMSDEFFKSFFNAVPKLNELTVINASLLNEVNRAEIFGRLCKFVTFIRFEDCTNCLTWELKTITFLTTSLWNNSERARDLNLTVVVKWPISVCPDIRKMLNLKIPVKLVNRAIEFWLPSLR